MSSEPTAPCSLSWIRSVQCDKSNVLSYASCLPLPQDNIFEWHFVVRGAADTEFEVGSEAATFCTGFHLCFLTRMQASWTDFPRLQISFLAVVGRAVPWPHPVAAGVPFQAAILLDAVPQRTLRDWGQGWLRS